MLYLCEDVSFTFYSSETKWYGKRFSLIILDSFTKTDFNLTWYKTGVHLNDLDLSNFQVRIDEVNHCELQKTPGKTLYIFVFIIDNWMHYASF